MDKALSSAKESDHVWAIYDEFGEYVCAYPTESQARIAAKDYYKPTVKKVMQEELEEGIFDSKATKEAEYRKDIKNFFNKEATPLVSAIVNVSNSLISNAINADHRDIETFTREIKALAAQLESAVKKSANVDPVHTIRNFGRRHAGIDDPYYEELKDLHTQLEKFKSVNAKAYAYLNSKVCAEIAKRVAQWKTSAETMLKDAKTTTIID
jgi:hypothetical protein